MTQDRCVLCGINAATSREHVPAESFFERPYPPDLITVPACARCNQGSQLDDDYFLAFLVSREIAGTPAVLDTVRDRVYRGLRRPERPGLHIRLLEASTLVRSGVGTERQRVAVETRSEGERMLRVLRKQARGLAFYLTDRIVPRSTFIGVERTFFLHTRPPEYWDHWIKGGEYAMSGRTGQMGDVFRYGYREIERSACVAAMRLEFYRVFSYTALVYRPDFTPPQRVRFPF
ncbi:MAG: hypothetical protein ACLPTF_10205 [Steroidobacteraceae bacterium]|jgi:hypothetical protein